MLTNDCLRELHSCWLPNITDRGLDRLIDLLEKGSPLLIHGSFTRAIPMGCLASHAAWNHPTTAHLTLDAGILWLNRVAGLNPATSHVVREWDACSASDYQIRAELLQLFKQSRQERQQLQSAPERELVEV